MSSLAVTVLQVLLAVAGVAYLILGIRSREFAHEPAGKPFVAFAVLTGASGLLLAVPPLLGVEVSLVLQSYAPLYLLPVAWAVFVLEYVGYSRVRSRPVLACLVGMPAASVAFNLLTWGREVGGGLLLVLSVGTIVALVTLLFAAGLAVGSVLLLLWTARRQEYVDWWSAILLAAGGSGPWFLTVAGFQTDLLVDGGGLPAVVPWAILGVGFAGCVVAFGTVVRREGLFERLPAPGNVGPDTVFEQLTEPVAVLDRNERIARANPAMLSTFRDGDGGLVGRGLDDVVGMNLPALRASPRFEFVTDGVDAGSDGSITVAVGATPDGFYVADDGAGIPADERDQVFEHGYTTRSEGTGFGLSIVREIVEAHDWSITVTESEDGGARFEISGVESESTG